MKTNTLTGRQLDLAVAMCLGKVIQVKTLTEGQHPAVQAILKPHLPKSQEWVYIRYSRTDIRFASIQNIPTYHNDWHEVGEIIEQHSIGLGKSGYGWVAALDKGEREFNGDGTTPHEAVLRCVVASILGDEVDLPVEMEIEHEDE